MTQNKYVVGLTGPTGAGKSTIASRLAEVGAFIIDTDVLAHRVMEKGQACLNETVSVFGTEILNNTGELVRKKLGAVVFNDHEALKKLSKISHKYIKRECIYELMTHKCEIAIIDGAVLLGSGIDKLCDTIVSVIADDDTRLRRICARDGISVDDAAKRMASQEDTQFYISHSDIIIHNNDSNDIATQVSNVWQELNEKRRQRIKG